MLPLGDWWTGECRAATEGSRDAIGAGCEAACNLGYGRGQCGWFPEGDGPDAVRFAISKHDGGLVRIAYVVERDHHPFANGTAEYSLDEGSLEGVPGETLGRQAMAYVASYLRRKRES